MQRKVQIVILTPNQVILFKTHGERGSFWQNITGSVEEGETFLQAANRELWEESGIQGEELIILKKTYEFKDRFGRDVIEHCFALLLDQTREITLSKEHCEYSWINTEEISENNYKYISNYQVFMEALENL
jgi:dATP pyrophosphohydrolase